MSASSRSTIFSIRSKKSKDSAEFPHTHAGPAYDDLPMAPRPPISVPTIIPPSQLQQLQQQQNGGGRGYYLGDEGDESDSYSVKSEPRNGYGGMRGGGSISAASFGGVSGPRPLPPRSGSAEKIQDVRYIPLGSHESPNVPYPPPKRRRINGGQKLHKKRASSDYGSTRSRLSNLSAISNPISRAMSPPPLSGDNGRSAIPTLYMS